MSNRFSEENVPRINCLWEKKQDKKENNRCERGSEKQEPKQGTKHLKRSETNFIIETHKKSVMLCSRWKWVRKGKRAKKEREDKLDKSAVWRDSCQLLRQNWQFRFSRRKETYKTLFIFRSVMNELRDPSLKLSFFLVVFFFFSGHNECR